MFSAIERWLHGVSTEPTYEQKRWKLAELLATENCFAPQEIDHYLGTIGFWTMALICRNAMQQGVSLDQAVWQYKRELYA